MYIVYNRKAFQTNNKFVLFLFCVRLVELDELGEFN